MHVFLVIRTHFTYFVPSHNLRNLTPHELEAIALLFQSLIAPQVISSFLELSALAGEPEELSSGSVALVPRFGFLFRCSAFALVGSTFRRALWLLAGLRQEKFISQNKKYGVRSCASPFIAASEPWESGTTPHWSQCYGWGGSVSWILEVRGRPLKFTLRPPTKNHHL